MTGTRATAMTLLLGVAALALSGCVQQPPAVAPTSTPTVAPVFKTDADALAAARATYTAYLAMSDEIAHDGGQDPGRISPFDTTKQLTSDEETSSDIRKSGDHTSGNSTISYFELQQISQQSRNFVVVVVYACVDVSDTRVFNNAGVNVTPPSRQSIVALQLTFRSQANRSRSFLVDRSDGWSGKNFC